MQQEMPRKYWRNLPEAPLIGSLALEANEHSLRLPAQPQSTAWQRLPAGRAAGPPDIQSL